jgi:hypothetical protein
MKRSHPKFKRVVITTFTGMAFALCTVVAPAQVRDVGIDAFLDQFPANASQFWSDPVNNNILRLDAYGKLNTFFNLGLPTTIFGKVTARDLGDGTEQVTVALHARNVFCQGSNLSTAPATPTFGYSPPQVVAGVGPAGVGDVFYRFVYAPQPAGQFDAGGELEFFFGTATCQGVLRAGSGYPEGTPGFAQTTQTGLLATGVPGGCPPEHDANCFPAEKVQFKPVGN